MRRNGERMKNNKPLTPKQRERLAREARRKNAQTAAAQAAVREKTPIAKETKWFLALVAVILVLATLASVLFGFLVVKWTEDPYLSVYETIRMKDYFDTGAMGKSFYTGADYDMSQYYRGEVTEDELQEYMNNLRLANKKEVALGQKETAIGYGDEVVYYILDAKDEKGNAIAAIKEQGYLVSSSYSSKSLTVGEEFYGPGFDEKIQGVKPSDTSLQLTYSGALTGDEVVIISFNAYKGTKIKDAADADISKNYKWGTSASKTLSGARLDLASQQESFRNALAEKVVGEDFSFILTDYSLTNDSSKVDYAVKFEAKVVAVVTEEKAYDITFTVPEGFFAADDKEMQATLSVIIPYMNDYEVPALDEAFVTETLGFETEESDVVATFTEAKRVELNKSITEGLHKTYVQRIFYLLGGKAKFLANGVPDDMWYEEYYALLEEYRRTYGTMPASEDEFNSYASSYGASSYTEVVTSNAKNKLIMYYIFDHANLRITDEMLEEAYREHVDELIAAGGDGVYTEEDILLLYTEEGLYKQARQNLVYDLVGEYLVEHNNIITESTK